MFALVHVNLVTNEASVLKTSPDYLKLFAEAREHAYALGISKVLAMRDNKVTIFSADDNCEAEPESFYQVVKIGD